LCGSAAPTAKIAALEAKGVRVEAIPEHTGGLSLPAVLNTLAERKILSVLLECGSHLNGAFLRENLVDKVVLFCAKDELGDEAVPFAEGYRSPQVIEERLQRVTQANFESDRCVTGYLHDPWKVEG